MALVPWPYLLSRKLSTSHPARNYIMTAKVVIQPTPAPTMNPILHPAPAPQRNLPSNLPLSLLLLTEPTPFLLLMYLSEGLGGWPSFLACYCQLHCCSGLGAFCRGLILRAPSSYLVYMLNINLHEVLN